MDNRVFNVNGRTKDQLKLALQLALFDEYDKNNTIAGWRTTKEDGLILMSYISSSSSIQSNKFPVPLNYEQLVDIVWTWLKSDEAKHVEQSGWDIDAPHDGHNNLGWRMYCGDWGRIGDDWGSIIAIKPAYLWYGK